MVDRVTEVAEFLRQAGWSTAKRHPITGDMSTRRYFRLVKDSQSVILMDAETDMAQFCKMSDWLRSAGLSAPRIFEAKAEAGLLLLEDFGDMSLKSKLIDEASLQHELFDLCVSLLLKIRETSPPRLPQPDAKEMVAWTEVVDAHYPRAKEGALIAFRDVLFRVLETSLNAEICVSLRDFHSENIMWLPDRVGVERLGLLDYQDAFLTHPAYDLVSLLTDARTWIPLEVRDRVVDRYLAMSNDDAAPFKQAFDALSAQRNLRILGIFLRAGRHLDCLPNTYRYFCEALENPVFSEVREEVLHAISQPKVHS